MRIKVNCVYNDNGVHCKHPSVPRSFFGFGARLCTDYPHPKDKPCPYSLQYQRNVPPPPPPVPRRHAGAIVHPAFVAFADDVLAMAWEGAGPDGDDIQQAALRHGLLCEVTVTEPCGEVCACAEVGEFPAVCYRKRYVPPYPDNVET